MAAFVFLALLMPVPLVWEGPPPRSAKIATAPSTMAAATIGTSRP
jgi:hypothetical protein